MKIDELDETGIELISVVDRPAIEVNFVKLSEEVEIIKLASDKQKQVVTGPVLQPDQLIYRKNGEQEFYITFTAEDIEKIHAKFMKNGVTKLSNLDHSGNDIIEGYLLESWIILDSDKDKSKALGFEGLKAGTLMASYHFPDANVWAEVSKRNGFSLEGSFVSEQIRLQAQETDAVESLLEELVRELESE
ncbi:XkdF-like putative serine protease domain-containing protein [uncultured Pontibacter sp.]|uniref:XkdF-like putative serine protease domain-containing protein n=1 Tax=uncultured Pontibacter sp. TaxID=453356 RepID=UPI0026277E6D|nr:XkdF-like putative serine protease domain-containing protein [uncultured Pontibacter sp.]